MLGRFEFFYLFLAAGHDVGQYVLPLGRVQNRRRQRFDVAGQGIERMGRTDGGLAFLGQCVSEARRTCFHALGIKVQRVGMLCLLAISVNTVSQASNTVRWMTQYTENETNVFSISE